MLFDPGWSDRPPTGGPQPPDDEMKKVLLALGPLPPAEDGNKIT